MKNLYLIICILALCGCSGFLEEYSQDKSYIKGYDDLDEILLGNAYFERFYVSNGWQFSGIAGKNYLPCLHVMSDELYNPQIQISAESETKRSIFREKDKTKRSKKESAQHSKSRNKSFVMTSVSAL